MIDSQNTYRSTRRNNDAGRERADTATTGAEACAWHHRGTSCESGIGSRSIGDILMRLCLVALGIHRVAAAISRGCDGGGRLFPRAGQVMCGGGRGGVSW